MQICPLPQSEIRAGSRPLRNRGDFIYIINAQVQLDFWTSTEHSNSAVTLKKTAIEDCQMKKLLVLLFLLPLICLLGRWGPGLRSLTVSCCF